MLPEDRRYVEDNFYRKGQTNVWFRLEALDRDDFDTASARRAVREFLLALRAEQDLKVSSFADITIENSTDEDDEGETAKVEFVVYNKLGTTSLSRLRRFMDEHLVSERNPRIILVDPETGDKFRATDFTIQYLFHDFVANAQHNDWLALRDHLTSDDRGYAALVSTTERTATMRRHADDKQLAMDLSLELEEVAEQISDLMHTACAIVWQYIDLTGRQEVRDHAKWIETILAHIGTGVDDRFPTLMNTINEMRED